MLSIQILNTIREAVVAVRATKCYLFKLLEVVSLFVKELELVVVVECYFLELNIVV